ncbi:hypothetical protein F2S72_09670 [Pseudomonas syringae pv. actinidiae]|nr:hypothetical protein [Pseudomonas syringae pv. actinidiae]
MCDEENTYTERARSWLKEFEPTLDQIQDAYSKMLAMLDKHPKVVSADTDQCLKVLVAAYGGVAGSEVDLAALVSATKETAVETAVTAPETGLDLGNLYEVSDGPVAELSPAEKRDAFKKLKAQFGGGALKRVENRGTAQMI